MAATEQLCLLANILLRLDSRRLCEQWACIGLTSATGEHHRHAYDDAIACRLERYVGSVNDQTTRRARRLAML
jgi:hypothetical protein